MLRILIAFLVAFGIGVIVAPIVIYLIKRVKANQTVLHYVTAHKSKDGTPTLGGIIFIIATIISFCLFSYGQASLGFVAMFIMLGKD